MSNTIAQTILAQLGGNRFLAMTDADLYDVRFLTIRGVNMTERGTVEGVHADSLAAVFTEQTGFDTHM